VLEKTLSSLACDAGIPSIQLAMLRNAGNCAAPRQNPSKSKSSSSANENSQVQ